MPLFTIVDGKMKWRRDIIIVTFLSVLLFFTISLLSILPYLIPFRESIATWGLDIGWPYNFYHEYHIGDNSFLGGWTLKTLIMDCVIIWVGTLFGYFLIKLKSKK
ncbi:MAG: hypothetical protein JXQ87_01365 [Bacteroidia bacterium]